MFKVNDFVVINDIGCAWNGRIVQITHRFPQGGTGNEDLYEVTQDNNTFTREPARNLRMATIEDIHHLKYDRD